MPRAIRENRWAEAAAKVCLPLLSNAGNTITCTPHVTGSACVLPIAQQGLSRAGVIDARRGARICPKCSRTFDRRCPDRAFALERPHARVIRANVAALAHTTRKTATTASAASCGMAAGGHVQCSTQCLLWANSGHRVNLFDHLVGATEQRQGNGNAERFGCLEIDDQLDLD